MKLLDTKRKTPEIPIIPLMDILAILLIFFIVSTTFKEPRPILEIDLPTVREVPASESLETRTVLAVNQKGEITFDLVPIELEKLSAHLKAYKNLHPTRKLELEADQKVDLKQLFAVWDALTAAGIEIKDVPARINLPATEAR